jgi:hypothetical protein
LSSSSQVFRIPYLTYNSPSPARLFPCIFCSLSVVAYTGSEDIPAFDGKAFVVLNGAWGSTDTEELVNDNLSYPAGVPQSFVIKSCDVGNLQSISVRTMATGTATK